LVLVAAAATLVGLAGLDADAATSGRFTMQGTVTGVTDADTIRVALRNGNVEEVRLIGIDAPERGACFASKATAIARSVAQGKPVTLKGDATQDTRDRYGRLLAYVWLPGGKDLGFHVVARGAAKTYVYARPFQRLSAYRAAEERGRRVTPSVWTCGRAPRKAPPTSSKCDPSYPDVCIPPYGQAGDLDCAEVPYSNFRVIGSDPHGFDGEGDGVGCED
jgi:micrococcal nuclease